LDVGSGVGLVDRFLAPAVPNLFGVDIEEGVVSKAAVNNPGVTYSVYNGEHLPFENSTMDFTFAINVMHHVPVILWQNFVNEMRRVLKPGGAAVVFEHNPFNPLTRRVVSKCEFDRDAVLLSHNKLANLFIKSGLALTEDSYILFFPFRGSAFRTVEKSMKWIPLGAQHYVLAKKV
jgi:SAM-dependent methyltransferase